MAARMRLLQRSRTSAPTARAIAAPTLVVTGEPRLDRVVPVESTREYVELIRGARYAMMDGPDTSGS